jgi:actin-related protein
MAEKDAPFFMIESLQNKRDNRYKMIEMLFEDLSFSSVFFYRSQLLAEYLVARETVLVVDAGAFSTQVVPIIDG